MREFPWLPTLPSLLSAPAVPLIHRDISWLQFNERVLAEARESSGNPLLERAKYLAITSSNLDEFFMIRFASIHRMLRTQVRHGNDLQSRHLESVRDSILEAVAEFGARQTEILDALANELAASRIHLVRHATESETAYELGRRVFEAEILGKLSAPETFEIGKVAALQNSELAVIFPGQLWFRVPRGLPSLLRAGDHFFFLDDLLETFLGTTFGVKGGAALVRVTRDADFTVELNEEDPESIPDMVLSGLGSREKGPPVRLQYRGALSGELLSALGAALRLIPQQVLPAAGSLLLAGLWTLVREAPEPLATRPGLRYPALPARVPRPLRVPEGIFDRLRRHDFLLHHPYDAFEAFVGWVRAAAEDPEVVLIEQTIYRMDPQSPLLEVLKAAAARKRVRVVIELRARFDEYSNLQLADELRKAGVEVSYGFGKLKLHAKVTLVTRREAGGMRWYTHLSTGNYNATTARQYTDLGILTANAEIGADARLFFDSVWEGEVPSGFKRLTLAPTKMHRRLLSLIEEETQAAREGRNTRIVAKVNALVDEQVIEALYGASRAGVTVDLIVRGACSLIPGVRDLSENIRVISVVDRFLEHSRLYYFESSRAMYLSSADWMPRNFFSRLEIAFPVLDERIFAYIEKVLIPTYLADNTKARELTLQGVWKRRIRRHGLPSVRSQVVFEDLAARGYDGTDLGEKSH